MTIRPGKLSALYDFLQRNRRWNEDFQMRDYRRGLLHCDSPNERLLHLLHAAANSQSQPSLDKLGVFWRLIHNFSAGGAPSLSDFTLYLEGKRRSNKRFNGPWERLFYTLAAQPGWGEKTSALFVKSAIQIHLAEPAIHFWADRDHILAELPNDRLYLPVDAVIRHIFCDLGLESCTFWSINKLLGKYSPEQMLVWDDLWYWGFFTQAGGSVRVSQWNQNKFWSQLSAQKSREAEVRTLAGEFLTLTRC